jgi:myo-inositol 2-dehydrogenase/D-chiro-inositol 1-dehydrogenase
LEELRVGLVGYGRYGKAHAWSISAVKGMKLAAVCVGTKETAEKVGSLGPVEVYSDYDEFLDKGNLDIVDVVSPNYLHVEHSVKAMAKGKDVMVEKPIAIDIDGARLLLEQQRKTGRKVQVGLQNRYSPFWRRLKSALDTGEVANPTFARFEIWRDPFKATSRGWGVEREKVGHYLLQHAIHRFDMAAWFFGMPEKISGFTDSPTTWSDGKYGSALALMEYRNGLKVIIMDTLNGVSDHLVASMSGDGAAIGMEMLGLDGVPMPPWVKVKDRTGTVRSESVPTSPKGELVLALQDFVDRLQKDEEPAVTLEDGFRAQLLADTAISAIGSGKVLAVPTS